MAKYNFKEKQLDPEFCKREVSEVKKLINSSTSFTVVGMPGMGISMFLRYLVCALEEDRNNLVVHIDINELPELSKDSFGKLLDQELGGPAKLKLDQAVSSEKKIVMVFNRFDRLQKLFDQTFFGNLRSLRDISKEKIVMIFSANKPLPELAPDAISGGNLNMFSKTYFLKPFSKSDLDKLVKLNTPTLAKQKNYQQSLLESGGHYQLLQLLLKEDSAAINLQLKELYNFLNYNQRKQLQAIAFGKTIKGIDPFLLELGFLTFGQKYHDRNINGNLFSQLFSEFVKRHSRLKLAKKEAQLFKLLKTNLGKLVSKDRIYNELWPDGEGSDWALDALVYRIRKNPTFISSGYILENQKKVGYMLIRN